MRTRTSILLLNLIAVAYSGLTDVYEDFLSKPQYQLYFSAEKWGPKTLRIKEDSGNTIIRLPVNKDGLTYACEIEKPVEIPKVVSEEDNKKAILTKALEQLEPLKEKPCIVYSQEWWSYEFCYKKYLTQFHVAKPTDPPEHNMNFYLGKYPTEEELENPDFEYKKEAYKRGPFGKHYITQMLVDGTICDVTGKPRQAEIRYYCGESETVTSIKEISTCNYIVIFNTPRLCNNPGFESKKSLNSILCHPISDHDEEENIELQEQPENLPFPVFRRQRSMAEIERSKEKPKKIYKKKNKKYQGVTFVKKDRKNIDDDNDKEKNDNKDKEEDQETKEKNEKRDALKKSLEDQLEKKRGEFLDALLPYANELKDIDDKVVDEVLNQLADSLVDAIDNSADKDSETKAKIKAENLDFQVITKEKLQSWLEKNEDKISSSDDMKFEVVLLDKDGKRYEVSSSDTDVENIMDFLKEFSTDNTGLNDILNFKDEKEKEKVKDNEESIEEIGIEDEEGNEIKEKGKDKVKKEIKNEEVKHKEENQNKKITESEEKISNQQKNNNNKDEL